MGRPRGAGIAGCKPDQAADQARADNGSQDTASNPAARAATVGAGERSKIGRVRFQRRGVMAERGAERQKGATRRGPYGRPVPQDTMRTGSPSGVRRMKDPTALASA